MNSTEKLARAFHAALRSDLDAQTLAEIDRRNATPAYSGACATHDYCDANEYMIESFCDVYGRAIDPADQQDADATNAAWAAAAGKGFAVEWA